MTRMLALCFAWLGLMLPIAQAVPAKPLYEPPMTRPTLELRGTSWQGQDHVPNYQITFEHDGTVTYGYNGKFKRGGSWLLEGNSLYFEVNKQYREFRSAVDGNTLQGDSWNKAGRRWQTRLQRSNTPK